jgi:hypothetical protein
MARHWTLSQRDLFEPAPLVSQLTEPERRKALELLQTLLAEASTQAREKTVENQAEACNDLPVAGGWQHTNRRIRLRALTPR